MSNNELLDDLTDLNNLLDLMQMKEYENDYDKLVVEYEKIFNKVMSAID